MTNFPNDLILYLATYFKCKFIAMFDDLSTISLAKLYTDLDHYSDVIMDAIVSQITSLRIVYSTVYSSVDQTKYQISASLAFVRGIHR